jgi:hypothetical protein
MPVNRMRSFLKNIQKTLHVVFTDEHEAELFVFLSVGAKRLGAGNIARASVAWKTTPKNSTKG